MVLRPADDLAVPLVSSDRRRLAADRRQAVLVALLHRLTALADAESRDRLDGACRIFSEMAEVRRRQFVLDPLVRIWMFLVKTELAGEAGHRAQFGYRDAATEICRLLEGRPRAKHRLRQGIGLIRDNPDPLLQRVAPPTYSFSGRARETAFTLNFFAEAADLAIRRIETVWPCVGAQMQSYIRLVVHVPDGDFRSCSAARYSGVVFLAAGDPTILSLEESLVHEWGHQVLYDAMELDPIVEEHDGPRIFTLPWSGAERDLYGYFHAYYIYTLLASYAARILKGPATYRKAEVRAARRLGKELLAGLAVAKADLENASEGGFTETGRSILAELEDSQRRISEVIHHGCRVRPASGTC